jgi:hypothetical protein
VRYGNPYANQTLAKDPRIISRRQDDVFRELIQLIKSVRSWSLPWLDVLVSLGGWDRYGYGSIPIHTIFRGMNIHLPAILMFTRGTRF